MSKKFIITLFLVVVIMLGFAKFTGSNKTSSDQPVSTPNDSLDAMVGKPAPDFSLNNQAGKLFKLSDMRGKKVVLFFNEGIICYPACWNQVAALGSDKDLNTDKVMTASVVVDNPSDWSSAFKKMPELNKEMLLFDSDKAVSMRYGMLNLGGSMHKGSKPGHTYIIIDQNGIVRYVKDDAQMGIRNSELLAEVAKL